MATLATNWTPSRVSPLNTDILTVGTATAQPSSGSITFATMAVSGNGILGGTYTGATTDTSGNLVGTFNNVTTGTDTNLTNVTITSGGRIAFSDTSFVPTIGDVSGSNSIGPTFSGAATVVAISDLACLFTDSGNDAPVLTNLTITIGGNFSSATSAFVAANIGSVDMTGTTVTTTGQGKFAVLANAGGSPTLSGFIAVLAAGNIKSGVNRGDGVLGTYTGSGGGGTTVIM